MKSILALTLPVVLALAACASNPRTADERAAQNAAVAKTVQETCIKDTGSRIKSKEGDCRGPGRTYSRDDLDRTGEINAADALRKLDPALQ